MQSTIWNAAIRVAEWIREKWKESLVGRTAGWYERANEAFERGAFSVSSKEGYDREGKQFKWRRRAMLACEASSLARGARQLNRALFACRVGDIGMFFLLMGTLLFILTCIRHDFSDNSQRHAALSMIVLALPLLPSGKSVARVLRDSRTINRFRMIADAQIYDPTDAPTQGKEHPLGVLTLTFASTAIAAVISPLGWCACVIFTITTLILLSFPEIGILTLALVFPILPILPHPTILLCALITIIQIGYTVKLLCGRRDVSLDLADAFVLLFCALLSFGGIIGFGNPLDGITLSLLASVYFPARHLMCSPHRKKQLRAALLCGAAVCASIGILQYVTHHAALKWVDASRFSDIGGRVTATFDNPNVLAIYLLLCFPIALCGALENRERVAKRIVFAIIAALIALCTTLTWTRGAWLGMIVESILILLTYSRSTLAATLTAIPFAVCAIPYLPINILRRFSSIGETADSSIRYRFYTWEGVSRTIAKHPWGIGVGEKAFCTVYPRYALSGIESVMHAHNIYLQITLEIGVAGLALFLASVTLVLLRAASRGDRLGNAFSIVGVLVMGFFDHLWYFRPLIALIFLSMGLSKDAPTSRT